ncbi:protein HIR1 [Kwoniella mangroviensis CBS 8886]|nr:protein HIR1 [Kwoniella mangroviensis CBS 8886]
MRCTKPSWVEHSVGEKKGRCPIYSISVHPDGTRIATGGLVSPSVDNKVKIWSTLPILDEEAEKDEANHKLLCTMAAHTGPVLTVRWAHHGRFLATGSDDQVIMIWGIDPEGAERLWGSEEVNHENWKALTRLVGHVADVVDLAWSRDDSMLASVGLDSKVWIWDGATFERLRKLDLHQGFVKGVCWDPVGNFLATQSDDKTVKVWNTEDWSLTHTVSEPFKTSPQSTFFRRLSWSPDGAFIAASNAMNGPVFVAAVIDREGWASDISFVGHENTIQVAAFNPRLFFKKEDKPGRATASCMLALGANDFSISIWRNTMHKPLVVLKEVFGRDLLDMCWSNDGYNLYGCSADGSICAVSFSPSEFPELGQPEMTEKVLEEYDYKPKRQPARGASIQPLSVSNSFGPSASTSSVVNVLQPRKKGQGSNRRVDLQNPASNSRPLQPPSRDPFSGPIQQFGDSSGHQASTAKMFEDAHTAFANGGQQVNGGSPRAGLKRKAALTSEEETRAVRGRLMATTPANTAPVEVLRAPLIAAQAGPSSSGRSLPVPQVQSVVRAALPHNEGSGYLEAHNAPSAEGVNKITFVKDGQGQWVDYLPSGVLSLAVTAKLCAAAMEDGSVMIYSPSGRQLSYLKLGSLCHDLQGNKDKLLIITSDCQVRVIETKNGRSVFPPTTLSPLLDSPSSTTTIDIKECTLRPNGIPIIVTSLPAAYAYDPSVSEWTLISSKHHIQSSPLASSSKGVDGEIERTVGSLWKGKKKDNSNQEWWNESMTMGHWETRIKACILLDSTDEYRDYIIQYITYLGNEGFIQRAEEVLKDLIGPVYRTSNGVNWDDKVVGLNKRDVAQVLVDCLGKTKNGGELARKYEILLGRLNGDGW